MARVLTLTSFAALAVLASAWLWMREQAGAALVSGEGEEVGQGVDWDAPVYSFMDDLLGAVSQMPEDQSAANLAAFLATIRHAEGTSGPNGYRTLFGGSLFSGWEDHPRVAKQFRDRAGRLLWTSAAGGYQLMAVSPIPGGGSTRVNTWDRIRQKLGLPDFSPSSQDAAAVELIREAGALRAVQAGEFDAAISKVRSIWASLPGAGYQQNERSIESLRAAYVAAGGYIA